MFVKLGEFKPIVTPPIYTPLTEREKIETEKQAKIVRECLPKQNFSYFDFFKCMPDIKRTLDFDKNSGSVLRMVYNYGELFGDNLLTGDFSAYSEEMLAKLAYCSCKSR